MTLISVKGNGVPAVFPSNNGKDSVAEVVRSSQVVKGEIAALEKKAD